MDNGGAAVATGLGVPTFRNLATRVPGVKSSPLLRHSKVRYQRLPALNLARDRKVTAGFAPKKVQF